jgi:hypothetical protein
MQLHLSAEFFLLTTKLHFHLKNLKLNKQTNNRIQNSKPIWIELCTGKSNRPKLQNNPGLNFLRPYIISSCSILNSLPYYGSQLLSSKFQPTTASHEKKPKRSKLYMSKTLRWLPCLIRKVRVIINYVVFLSSFRSKTANGNTSGKLSNACHFSVISELYLQTQRV